MCEGSANQQGAGEPGTLGVADALEISHLALCALENQARERHQALDMVAGREFRNDAAVDLVHRDLRMHGVGEQPAPGAVVQGDTGFIARSLDSKDEHGTDFDTIQPPKEPRAGCQQ